MNDLLNTAPCGFLSLSSDGTMQVVNSTLAGWLSSATDQLEGKSIKSILSVGGRVFYETHFWPQLELQGQIEEIYFSLRSMSGESVPVLANASRVERGGVIVYDCVFLRMRQRNQYENELIMAKNEAEKANQAKADFLSMMSHELRTPLNAISGFTQIIASEGSGPLTPAQHEDLDCIKRGSDQLLRLINDILNYAQMERGQVGVELENVDVQEAILRAESFLKPRLQEAEIQFRSEIVDTNLIVRADPDRLQQILLNLLTNAIKFTPSGGEITVQPELFENQVLIKVSDTGCGIPDDHIGRIFDPFVQVDRMQVESSQRGVGLGLAICRKLARSMSGDLTVLSTVGEGSEFTLSLPVVD